MRLQNIVLLSIGAVLGTIDSVIASANAVIIKKIPDIREDFIFVAMNDIKSSRHILSGNALFELSNAVAYH